jgi:hypothetical protein
LHALELIAERGSQAALARGYAPIFRAIGDPLARLRHEVEPTMRRRGIAVLYVLALVAVVVGLDILFFRHHFFERLVVNVGIVVVFAAFYLTFLKGR